MTRTRGWLALYVVVVAVGFLPSAVAETWVAFGATGGCQPLFAPTGVPVNPDPILSTVTSAVTLPTTPSFPPSLPTTPLTPTEPGDLCGTSEAGAITVSCDASSCDLRVTVQGHGWSSAPGLLRLRAGYWQDGWQPICERHAFAASSVSCAGSQTFAEGVLANECIGGPEDPGRLRVETALWVNRVDTPPQNVTTAESQATAFFKLCRDADGVPSIEQWFGGPRIPGFAWAAALLGLAAIVVAARRRA